MRIYSKIKWEKVKDRVNIPAAACVRHGRPYQNGNVFVSSYCPECAEDVRREKTRERVRKFRRKKGCD